MLADIDTQWALNHTLPIAPQIHRHLRARIIRGDLRPGQPVSETEIAKRCDTSRQPVREAFIKLAEEGLLTVRPQRGTFVNKVVQSAVLDARFVREAVESDIVRILAQQPDPSLVRELRRLLAIQSEAPSQSPIDFSALDEMFHRTLAEGAGRIGAWHVIQGLKAQMDRVRFMALGQFPVERLIGQHIRIVDAIEAGRADSAERTMRTHLREVLRDLPTIMAAKPEFFELPAGILPEPANAPLPKGAPFNEEDNT